MQVQPKKIILGLLLIAILVPSVIAAVKTFRVEETDFVKINAKAIDPDNDEVTYKFGEPLDELGEWQTDYGDAGEYEVEITASDGIDESIRKIKIIVEDKNQPPFVKEKKFIVKESQVVDLKELVEDPNGDVLTFQFVNPFNQDGEWKTDFNDAGSLTTRITVSDGEFTITDLVEIQVLPTNQPPEIIQVFAGEEEIEIKEDQTLSFFVKTVDHDGDKVSYRWELDEKVLTESESGKISFSFEDAGEHQLVLYLNDGIKEISREWVINVENVNRKPEVELLPITVFEGDKIILDLPDMDLDKDDLTYMFEEPLDDEGVWETSFDDAGIYQLEVVAFDGELKGKGFVEITVIDVDRKPELNLPAEIIVNEDELLNFNIDTYDPDGDKISFSFEGLPEGAIFVNETIAWKPTYDEISRKKGIISNTLNSLRLEHFFLREKIYPVKISVCGKNLCNFGEVDLVVKNVNRPPTFGDLPFLKFKETDLVEFTHQAIDPDGDIIKYTYNWPLDDNGKWKTNYDDADIYTTFVTASDGFLETVVPVQLIVNNNNREPLLEVKKDEFVIDEKEELIFSLEAFDPDNDNLTLWLEDLPSGASFNEGVFSWQPDYDTVINESEIIWLEFVASDDDFDTVHPVKVTVNNVNRPPEIIDYLPTEKMTVRMYEPVVFHVLAEDGDGDSLEYKWSFGIGQDKVIGTDTIERKFTVAGNKIVKVTVSDGEEEVEKAFAVKVLEREYVAPVAEPYSFKVYVIE